MAIPLQDLLSSVSLEWLKKKKKWKRNVNLVFCVWFNIYCIPLIKVKASGIDCVVCDLAWHWAKSHTWLDFSTALIMTHMRHAIEILCFQFHPASSTRRWQGCVYEALPFFLFFFLLTSAPHTISRGIRWYLRERTGSTGQHVMTAWS